MLSVLNSVFIKRGRLETPMTVAVLSIQIIYANTRNPVSHPCVRDLNATDIASVPVCAKLKIYSAIFYLCPHIFPAA